MQSISGHIAVFCLAMATLTLAACSGGSSGVDGSPTDGDGSSITELAAAGPAPARLASTSAISGMALAPAVAAADPEVIEASVSDTTMTDTAALAALAGGEVEVVAVSATAALRGQEATGGSLRILSQLSTVGLDDDVSGAGVFVSPDQLFTSVGSLVNKRVGVSSADSFLVTAARQAVSDLGGDDATIEFVVTPIDDLIEQMRSGGIDAALLQEPEATKAFLDGMVRVDTLGKHLCSGEICPVMVVVTTAEWADDYPEAANELRARLATSVSAAAADESTARAELENCCAVEPSVGEKLKLPIWESTIDETELERLAEVMADQGDLSDTEGATTLLGG